MSFQRASVRPLNCPTRHTRDAQRFHHHRGVRSENHAKTAALRRQRKKPPRVIRRVVAIVSRAATATPATVVVAVGDGVGRGIAAMTDRETAVQMADLMVGLTAARGVAPVAAARVILTLHATTPKLG